MRAIERVQKERYVHFRIISLNTKNSADKYQYFSLKNI